MSTLRKVAMGLMGQLRPKPAIGDAAQAIALPQPQREGGMPLMDALAKRQSRREFASTALPLPLLSSLLWAAWGSNRNEGRTAPSALNIQEIDLYIALPNGAYYYDAVAHRLNPVAATDVRGVTGYQDFVDDAPLDIVFVANHARMRLVPVEQREMFAAVATGAICQNIYLFAAANDLATVIRAWIDREAIARALGLSYEQRVLLSQTVGFPKS